MKIDNQKIIKNIRKKINSFLSQSKQRLPRKGILTGQSLATIYLEEIKFNKYKNKKEIKINDIDVFYPMENNYTISKKYKIRKKSKLKLIERGYSFYIDEINAYEIIDSNFDRLINKTKIIYENQRIKEPIEMLIINSFDFNVVQIALNLETNELFITKEFNEFIKTGELKITDLISPHHTAIRLIKKIEEHGYYCNFNTEILKCKYIIDNSLDLKKYFSDKYKDIFNKYSDKLTEHFKLRKINLQLEWDISDEDFACYQEDSSFDFSINLYTLDFKIKEKEIENYPFLSMNFDTYSEFITYVNMYMKIKKNNFDYLTNTYQQLEKKIDFYSGKRTLFSIVFKNKEIKSKQKLKELVSYLNKHSNLSVYFYKKDMDEVNYLLNIFKKIEKKYGSISIGVLETFSKNIIQNSTVNNRFRTLRNLLKTLKNEIEIESIPLNDYTIIKENINHKYHIKELNTSIELKEEGSYMNHCVGGYARKVLHTDSIIVSVRYINDKSKDMTFELGNFFINKKEEINFNVFQAYHRNNTIIEENLYKDCCSFIKKSINTENFIKKLKRKKEIEEKNNYY